jgi:hypothetical protein
MPEIAGFIDGCYNTYKSIPETDDAIEAATEVARDFAFNYTLNRDGYRDAVNNLVTEALTNLDTYIKLANGIVAAEDKIVNIYKGTTPEDRYWRGIIVFEVASTVFPLSKTKTAAKTASGIRQLLDDLKKFKIGKLFTERIGAASLEDLLKNSKFKDIYQPLETGAHVRKYLQYNVTTSEEAALKLFIQDDYYAAFNKALVGDIPMTAEYAAIRDLMISAHSKMPKQVGLKVFRGAGSSESTFAKNLVKGKKFTFNGKFTSSSIDEYTAETFRYSGKGNVIWEIESKTGVDLKLINSAESEILFKPNTQFELIDIVPSSKTPNVFIYRIKEI